MIENTVIELEMGIPEKDFDSVLGKAVEPYAVQTTPTGFLLTNDQQQEITIDKTQLSPRVIASARLPRMLVVITLKGHSEADVTVFKKRFDRYMHRGGG